MNARPALAVVAMGVAIATMAAPIARAAESPPDWLEAARHLPTPAGAESPDVVVLRQEIRVEMDRSGRYREVRRRVLRVLTTAGASSARALVFYRSDGDKVRSLEAWTIAPSGETRRYRGNDVVDAALRGEALYNEVRFRVIDATDVVRPGWVFGFESVAERRSPFPQFLWQAQDEYATVASRFEILPPEGWLVDWWLSGAPATEPIVREGAWIWEWRDLPAVAPEALRPPVGAIVPRLGINLRPPEGARGDALTPIRSWEEASAWVAERVASLDPPGEALRRKAASLAGSDTLATVRAVAAFVQGLHYVSIDMGMSQGGGYVPRPGSSVLAHGYGDCKDKANLMRELLASLGIESRLVLLRTVAGSRILERFPAIEQFDHCIIGIRLGASMPTSIEDPSLGRLALFDPTDPTTPWGSLPASEWDARALVVAGHGGALVRLPSPPPRFHRRERVISGVLDASGAIAGSLMLRAEGGAASSWRATLRNEGLAAIRQERRWWLGTDASAARIDSFSIDAPEGEPVRIDAAFEAPRIGSPMGARLLILDPARLSTLYVPDLPDTPRVHPVVVASDHYEEHIALRLPEGFALDEGPPPLLSETTFGAVRAECRVEDGLLRIDRSLERRGEWLPVERYAEARRFFDEARRAFAAKVVLTRR